MKKAPLFLVLIVSFALLTACRGNSKANTPTGATTNTTQTTDETTTSIESSTETETTVFVDTEETKPAQKPDKPAENKPSKPSTQKPAQNKPGSGTVNDSNIVDQGLCNGAAGNWKLTKDGTLTIYGNARLESSNSYPWDKYANQIKKVVVEEGILSIPVYAFDDFKNIKEVFLPNSIESIGEHAFMNCTGLKEITIPPKVTELEPGVLGGCTSLTSIKYAPGSKLHTLHAGALSHTGLKEFVAPPTLIIIKSKAFVSDPYLESVILTGSIKEIEARAFEDCYLLKKLVIGADVTGIHPSAFVQCNTIQHYESYASTNISLRSLPHLKSVIIAGNVSKAPSLSGCTSLESVNISSPITSIQSGYFMGCTALKSITFPETIKTIEKDAFVKSGIQALTIPASVEELGINLFVNTDLQSITFKGNPPTFKSNATDNVFSGLDNLTAYYPADNPAWTEEILKNYGAKNVTWIAK